MAEPADMQAAKDLIEPNAAEHGFDDDAIAARLDLPQSVNKIAAAYWRKRANDTLYLVNTSESGSSRALDSIYPRLVALAEKFEAMVVEEETTVDPPIETGRLGSIGMKRV